MAINNIFGELATTALIDWLTDKSLWLVARSRERVDATAEDCALCAGLRGAIMFPELASISQETLTEAVDEHEHYKLVDVEVFRVRAHMKGHRIVPDDDRPIQSSATLCSIAAHDSNDVMLLSVNLEPTTTLNTLTLKIGELSY